MSHDFSECKVCGSDARPSYRLTYSGAESTIYACTRCQLHYIDFLDDPIQQGSPELTDQFRDHIARGLESNTKRFGWQSGLVREHVNLSGAKVLDVGAGSGKFLSSMREHGAVPLGIEPDRKRAAFARQTYGLDLSPALIESSYWQSEFAGTIDAICLWDVIEHVNFPKDVLEKATRLLAPGGKLFIDTPTRDSLYYRLGQLLYTSTVGRCSFLLRSMYSPTQFSHKQIFSLQQIVSLLEEVGLAVVHTRTFHELTFPNIFYLRRILRSEVAAQLASPVVSMLIKGSRVRNKMAIVGELAGK